MTVAKMFKVQIINGYTLHELVQQLAARSSVELTTK